MKTILAPCPTFPQSLSQYSITDVYIPCTRGGGKRISYLLHIFFSTLRHSAVCSNLLKRRGCSVVNLFPREVPRVLDLFPRELIESTPNDFPNANPKLHQRPDTRPKTRGAADSPQYTRSFSTDCHSNQISTVNKQTE